MADEIDLNSDQASINLYADSDLAPLSSLFNEMGNDRSGWTKFWNVADLAVDLAAAVPTARSKFICSQ